MTEVDVLDQPVGLALSTNEMTTIQAALAAAKESGIVREAVADSAFQKLDDAIERWAVGEYEVTWVAHISGTATVTAKNAEEAEAEVVEWTMDDIDQADVTDIEIEVETVERSGPDA